MDQKLRVGILGATGMVGQRFISLLENHPYCFLYSIIGNIISKINISYIFY